MMKLPARLLQEIRDRTSIVDLVRGDVALTQRGTIYEGLCPFHAEKSPSFKVYEAEAHFHCFGCGAHGDGLDWLVKYRNLAFLEAVAELAWRAGLEVPEAIGRRRDLPPRPLAPVIERPSVQQQAAKRSEDIDEARWIVAAAIPAAGTLAEIYWRARGLSFAIPRSLRFLPQHPYFHRWKDAESGEWRVEKGEYPCLVSPIQDPAGRVWGVHRTWLAPDGSGKAPVSRPKKMLGAFQTGAVRLTAAAPVMLIGEGIESSASGLEMTADERGVPMWEGIAAGVWAALSIGNMAGGGRGRGEPHPQKEGKFLPALAPDRFRPSLVLPEICRHVVLLCDGDNKDQAAADAEYERAALRYRGLDGRRVTLWPAPAGLDHNDLLRRVRGLA